MARFKVGDKVVCISTSDNDSLKKYQVYTVSEALTHMVKLNEIGRLRLNERFMLLSEFRKKKIKSLYE